MLTVYEKPTCSKCRELIALLTDRGVGLERIDFQTTGLTEAQLRDLLGKLGTGPREVLRAGEPVARELGLPGDRSDDELIALIAEHPQLLQRPIVVRGDRAVLARPAELVNQLLD
jgi:arsenate reductase